MRCNGDEYYSNALEAVATVLNGALNNCFLQEGSQSYFRELMFKGTGVQCSWDTFVIMGISECGPRINEHSWSDHGRT